MVNLGLMGSIPHQSQAQQVRGLFSPPGFNTTYQGGGGGDSPKPEPFETTADVFGALYSANKPTLERAGEIENIIAQDKEKEWTAIFSPSGTLIHMFEGGKRGTKLDKDMLKLFKGATVIHNHPSGDLDLSPTDIDLVRKHGAKHLVVVTPKRDGYGRKEWTDKEVRRLYVQRRRY